jgi:hypothetical protein
MNTPAERREQLKTLAKRAIFDPGQFTKRGDDYNERLDLWQARALDIAFADFTLGKCNNLELTRCEFKLSVSTLNAGSE